MARRAQPENVLFNLRAEKPPILSCGVDECGVGSAVGEVYVGCCILDPSRRIRGLADSKALTAKRRSELALEIREKALAWSIATASLEEIEKHNVLGATMLAMVRAVEALPIKPEMVLVDGNRLPNFGITARAIIKGDAKVRAISAASIIAKVARDQKMVEYHGLFPNYGFDEHKGYMTEDHLANLKKFGPCPLHRREYEPVKMLLPDSAATQAMFF